MASMFGGGPKYRPAPTVTDPAVQAAAQAQRMAAAGAMGQSGTILTSGLGDLSTPTTAPKTLLGS